MTTPGGGPEVDPDVAWVVAGYRNLNARQQQQFLAWVRRFISDGGDIETRGKFGNRMNVGPTRDTCTCCGR